MDNIRDADSSPFIYNFMLYVLILANINKIKFLATCKS